MPLAAWATLVIAAIIIAVTAVALIRVIMHLTHVCYTLATVIVGVRAIAFQTRTVPTALTSVNANLKPVRDFCQSV